MNYSSGAMVFSTNPISFTGHFSCRTLSRVTWRHLASVAWKSASISGMQSVPHRYVAHSKWWYRLR